MTRPDLSECDPGIRPYVETLLSGGVETFESCQGGPGHFDEVPWIRFHGGVSAGMFAVHIAMQHGLPVAELQRTWSVIDGELTGPHWKMTFKERAPYNAETERDALGELRKQGSA